MILRRLSQSLKEQNWTAIVIEFFLLVSGVFLGMQVSNWNEQRETNRKADVFTARLIDDLKKEAWAYEYLLQYNRETNLNQRLVLDAMSDKATISDEQFVIGAYRATQYIYNIRFRATFDELVSTGNIELIEDQALRTTAISIFTTPMFEQITQSTRESEYRLLFRSSVSAEVQAALLARCGDHYATVLDYASIKDTINYPCSLGLPAADVRAAVNALKASPRFAPSLRVRFADNQSALTDLQQGSIAALKSLRAIRDSKP